MNMVPLYVYGGGYPWYVLGLYESEACVDPAGEEGEKSCSLAACCVQAASGSSWVVSRGGGGGHATGGASLKNFLSFM